METPVPSVPGSSAPSEAPRRRMSTALLEIVGYGGAAAALASSAIAIGDLASETTQILTSIAIVIVLLAAGWFVGETKHDAFHRMRSIFWFLALISWVSATSLVLNQIDDSMDPRWMVVVTAAIAAALALPMWWVERRSLQLIGVFLALHVAAVTLVYGETTEEVLFGIQTVPQTLWIALVTMAFGLGAGLLGLRGVVRPRRTSMVLGSIALILGALVVDVDWLEGGPSTSSVVLALAVAVLVLAAGSAADELAPTGVGIAGVLFLSSVFVTDAVSTRGPAIGVLVAGLLLVGLTIVGGRRSGARPATSSPPGSPAPPLPPPPSA